jgi:hypothetical protein
VKTWIVYCGKELGTVLARSEEEALKMAAAWWGRGRAYTVKQVEKKR